MREVIIEVGNNNMYLFYIIPEPWCLDISNFENNARAATLKINE